MPTEFREALRPAVDSDSNRSLVRVKVGRIFGTYGPRMHPNDGRVVSNFIVQALRNEPITVCGERAQTRSSCRVGDFFEKIVRLIATPAGFTGPVNFGNPTELTIADLAKRGIAITHCALPVAARRPRAEKARLQAR